jgi:hypothetical protein
MADEARCEIPAFQLGATSRSTSNNPSGGSYRCGWTDAKTLEIGLMAVHEGPNGRVSVQNK